MKKRAAFFLVGLLALGALPGTQAADAAPAPGTIELRDGLVIAGTGRAGRNTLFTDAVEARLVAGTWTMPVVGEALEVGGGEFRFWTNGPLDRAAGGGGSRGQRGSWTAFRLESLEERIMILHAASHSMAYVNGEPRAGDVYGYGYVQLPVRLMRGENRFLFPSGRGALKASLVPPKATAFFNLSDVTAPDLRVGERLEARAAVIVLNATTEWAKQLRIEATVDGQHGEVTPVPAIPPLGLRKVGIRIGGRAPKREGKVRLELVLKDGTRGGRSLDVGGLDLRVRRADQVYQRTFVSGIDGSIQYFGVNPGRAAADGPGQALFLSLHGASVEGLGQAEAYGPKRWGTLVAPTNRRPYGFDWEEWGRMDALEVLDQATALFRPDPSKVYLTGHSMGGHGTWNLGATFPDRFAAIAPSAGWISFFSYAGTDAFAAPSPVERMLRRSAASSDTLAMATNHLRHGVYILHGDADDNVPVTEARRMREILGGFHRDFDWHEQPKAGHWWGNSDEPGAACVDWPAMFDFFARHRRPESRDLRRVRFVTMNPGVSSRSAWLEIGQQLHSLERSAVDALWDPGLARVTASTENVRHLSLDSGVFGRPPESGFTVVLDGQRLEKLLPIPDLDEAAGRTGAGRLHFAWEGGTWRSAGPLRATEKNPARSGPFKDAFRHRMMFVVGTRGSVEENAWALAKARFDAESFWYRGNGDVEVLTDVDFVPARAKDRGVIVYGHADMNSAWATLLAGSPVRVGRGWVKVGERVVRRDDLGAMFVQPRPDSAVACVGVVAGSGPSGLRLTQRLPYFMAGTGYPDCLVIEPAVLARGTQGIVAAGFFGQDWSVERGDFEWSSEAR